MFTNNVPASTWRWITEANLISYKLWNSNWIWMVGYSPITRFITFLLIIFNPLNVSHYKKKWLFFKEFSVIKSICDANSKCLMLLFTFPLSYDNNIEPLCAEYKLVNNSGNCPTIARIPEPIKNSFWNGFGVVINPNQTFRNQLGTDQTVCFESYN